MPNNVNVVVKINQGAIFGVLDSIDTSKNMDKLAEAALHMQETLVPVDTANLKRHLQIRKLPHGERHIGVFDKVPLIPADYAIPVETGHRTKAGTWVPAQPYIRPSIDAVRARLRST